MTTNAKNLVLAAAAAGGMFLILKSYAARPKTSTAFLNPQSFNLSGGSIGVFGGAGITQEQAAANATADYNNQFISPWTTGYGVMR